MLSEKDVNKVLLTFGQFRTLLKYLETFLIKIRNSEEPFSHLAVNLKGKINLIKSYDFFLLSAGLSSL